MEYILRLLLKHGIRDVLVTLQYKPEMIMEYFGNGSALGMHIRYFIEDQPLGTAGSVKSVEGYLNEPFLVVSGDAMTDIDLTSALDYHRSKGSTATIVLTRVPTPLEYGVVIIDETGRIRRFLEKPSWSEVFSDMVNTGIYVLQPEVLSWIPAGQPFDFSKDLFPKLLESGEPMYGYEAKGYWCDVGNIEAYAATHIDILAGKLDVPIPGKQIRTGVWVEDGTQIHPTAVLNAPAYIGSHCKIGANAEIGAYSVLSEQILVGANSSLKRSVIWDNVYLGNEVEIRGAILCDRVSVKDRCAVFEGAVIGPDSTIGQRVIVKPGVKIWPDKFVSPGTTLSSSVIWGSTAFSRLFCTLGVSGAFNVEITSEFAAKLGAAYGSRLKAEAPVIVASDGAKASDVVKQAISAGILSSGRDVRDIKTATMPLTRFAVAKLGSVGGVYVCRSPGDQNGILMRFMDEQALDIDSSTQRGIERDFFSGDFSRAPASACGSITTVRDIGTHYLKELLATVDREAVRRSGFKAVLQVNRLTTSPLVQRLMSELGVDAVILDEAPEFGDSSGVETDGDRVLEGLVRISQQVVSSGADIGALVDSSGEHVMLVDELGSSLSSESFLALLSLMTLRQRTGARVVAPVTAPRVIDRLAERFNGAVVRTKANVRSMMEMMVRQKVSIGGSDLPSFQPAFDAVAALARLLEFMAKEGVSLSSIMTRVPPIHMDRATVACPWDRKGQVMRTLIETEPKDKMELLDGIKVYHGSGWALVLPDSDEPVFHVYCEAASMESAIELKELYVSKINKISSADDPMGRSGDRTHEL